MDPLRAIPANLLLYYGSARHYFAVSPTSPTSGDEPFATYREPGGAARSALRAKYDPGEFVFDFFNNAQVMDLAQGLGLDPMVSRHVTREIKSSDDASLSVKVLAVTRGREQGFAESATHLGVTPTAILIEILSALYKRGRLWTPQGCSVEAIADTCKTAASDRGWVVIPGLWRVATDPFRLELLRASEEYEPLDDRLSLRVDVPARVTDLTATGRVRFMADRQIRADIFAQSELWSDDKRQFVGIAHAVFARMGDRRFRWPSSYHPGGGGAGSDWE